MGEFIQSNKIFRQHQQSMSTSQLNKVKSVDELIKLANNLPHVTKLSLFEKSNSLLEDNIDTVLSIFPKLTIFTVMTEDDIFKLGYSDECLYDFYDRIAETDTELRIWGDCSVSFLKDRIEFFDFGGSLGIHRDGQFKREECAKNYKRGTA